MVYLKQRRNNMKESNLNNLKIFKTINDLGIFIQAILVIVLVVIIGVSYFVPGLENLIRIIMSIILLIMSYNNEKTTQKRSLTYVYGLVGLASLVLTIVGMF
jgi:hypothetical protein